MRNSTDKLSPYLHSERKEQLDMAIAGSLGAIAVTAGMAAGALNSLVNQSHPLFRQVRRGMNGKPFSIIKLKTLNEQGEPLRLGSFLRKSGLDETLQFIHVVRGEMSVVGPRPVTSAVLNEVYALLKNHQDSSMPAVKHWLELREQALPGITGAGQVVRGNYPRGSTAHRIAWVSAEYDYLTTADLRRDIGIIATTPLIALLRTNHTSQLDTVGEPIAANESVGVA